MSSKRIKAMYGDRFVVFGGRWKIEICDNKSWCTIFLQLFTEKKRSKGICE